MQTMTRAMIDGWMDSNRLLLGWQIAAVQQSAKAANDGAIRMKADLELLRDWNEGVVKVWADALAPKKAD